MVHKSEHNITMHVYSQDIKNKVRLLRLKGLSLGQIQKQVNIPKTTIHLWIAQVNMSMQQREAIRRNALSALQEGRVKAQKIQKEKSRLKQKKFLDEGVSKIGDLSYKELFIAGIALYWAEGFKNKHERRLGFCNSDANMLRFYVHWLEKCLGINKKDLVARLTLNKSYLEETKNIEEYWSQMIGIPLSQFTKPFYQNSLWKKQFKENNYHGVLRIHVKNSLEHLLEMKGWLEGLRLSLPT